MIQRQDLHQDECGTILLVEHATSAGKQLRRHVQNRGFKVVWATSAAEALQLLDDAVFIDSKPNALLANLTLSDTTAYRVVAEYQSEVPGAPVAMMAAPNCITTVFWAKARSIHLLKKPVMARDLDSWLSTLPAAELVPV